MRKKTLPNRPRRVNRWHRSPEHVAALLPGALRVTGDPRALVIADALREGRDPSAALAEYFAARDHQAA